MKRLCETCTHSDCYFNKYCTEEWKPIISHYKSSLEFAAGDTIFKEGDTVKGIYEIYSGKIKIVSRFNDGKERIVRLAKSEQVLGHRGFGSDLTYPVSAIALEKSHITFIPIDIYYKIVKANPELSFQLMMFYADELKNTEKRMKALSLMTAKEKVASALLMVIESFGFDEDDKTLLSFSPSRKDIASIASTTYETVVRGLSDFEKLGLIQLEGKVIRILDIDHLQKLCSKYF
jgi:CRP/FNR family transcriptional regulator